MRTGISPTTPVARNSSSTAFRWIGQQIPAGLGMGIEDKTPDVHRKLASMVPTSQGYRMESPKDGFGLGIPIQVHNEFHGSDPVENAHKVVNALVWASKR